ncbi:galactokinase [Brachybacterium sp. EF45031]|uniref:galactokinase n=1 Tax=Brachybacterium sillae TaxID=2810536 RepID=UPI00217E17FE|nr:galactokinase [Brachybacterium sillae]MCS6711265.1 galactokinase [Brachybacterium sillae]
MSHPSDQPTPAPTAADAAPGPRLASAPDRELRARRTAELFQDAWGYAPDGVWSAPGRVNLIGEHVDYQDGLCLPMALEHRTYVAAARTPTDRVRLRSAQAEGVVELSAKDLEPGTVAGWPAYVAGVLWALRGHLSGGEPWGLDLVVDGQVPLGAGLSSSAALECAVAAALEDLFTLGTEPVERIRAAIRAENDFVGAATGGLDQSAAVLGRRGHALLLDCRDFSVEPVPWDLAAQGLALLITDTRAEHSLVGGEYAERRRQSEQAAEALGVGTLRDVDPAGLPGALEAIADETVRRRARHIITEIERVRRVGALLEAGSVRGQLDQIAALMDASHDSLRDDYEVTVPALDSAVDAARAAGAHGARMTGGGFGGSTIALVEHDRAEAVAEEIARAAETRGLPAPHFFLALPGDGAGRDL